MPLFRITTLRNSADMFTRSASLCVHHTLPLPNVRIIAHGYRVATNLLALLFQILVDKLSRTEDFNPGVSACLSQRFISAGNSLRATGDCACEKLIIIGIAANSLASSWPTRSYSLRMSGDTTRVSLPRRHASRISYGGPEKKIPETKTLVSRMILISSFSPLQLPLRRRIVSCRLPAPVAGLCG